MSSIAFIIFAAFIAGVASQTVMVNTPTSAVQCLPVLLSWSGGQAPYFLSLIPAGQTTSNPLQDLGQQTGTSFTWKVNLPPKTAVNVQIRDSLGVLNYSDQFTIQDPPIGVDCSETSSTGMV
ncbi:secreted protein [Melampsora americana]|nr:secreted protein [Melampsora americana]